MQRDEEFKIETEYYENGKKMRELYYKRDRIHREGAPAWIEYYEDGRKKCEFWMFNGRNHIDQTGE
jgi:antitoxin component YwqK of YwqJK toxin-antitoxin module